MPAQITTTHDQPGLGLNGFGRASRSEEHAEGKGLRFIDYPEFFEIPSEYVGIDDASEEYQLVHWTFDWEPRTDYPTCRVREVRRPELEKRMLNSPRG